MHLRCGNSSNLTTLEMELRLILLIVALSHAVSALDVEPDDFLYPGDSDTGNSSRLETIQSNNQARYRRSDPLEKFKNKYTSLQKKFASIPDKYKPKLQAVLEKLNSTVANIDVNDSVEKLQKVAESLEKNWDSLSGDDATEVAKAVCDVIGTIGGLAPPPAGTVISLMMGLISGILGMNGPKQKTMGEIVQEVIKKELREQHMLELKAKIQRAVEILELNQVFLNGYAGKDLTQKDYGFMNSQFNALTHLGLRSELAHIIEEFAKNTDKDNATYAITLLDGYVTIASMAEILMHTMKSILDADSETKLSGETLGLTIEAARKQTERHLWFLRNPKVENGAMIALYDPAKHPNVEAILDSLNITSSADSLDKSGCYRLTDKHMGMDIKLDQGTLSGRAGIPITLEFVKIGKSWNMKTPQGPVCDFLNYFYQTRGCKGGPESRYRIYAFKQSEYMIINENKPTTPLFMKETKKFIGYNPGTGSQFKTSFDVSAEEKTWTSDNPEYVWTLLKVSC